MRGAINLSVAKTCFTVGPKFSDRGSNSAAGIVAITGISHNRDQREPAAVIRQSSYPSLESRNRRNDALAELGRDHVPEDDFGVLPPPSEC